MNILSLDFETTGLVKHESAGLAAQPKIIEIGAASMDECGNELDSYSAYVYPGEKLSPDVKRITGINDEDIQHAPRVAERLPRLRFFFEMADVLVAHNLAFDTQVLQAELDRTGIVDWPWPDIMICTVQEFAPAWGKRPKLDALYEDITGHKANQTHRALDDVYLLMDVVRRGGIIDAIKARD